MKRFDRNVRFFGKDGQIKFRESHIAVIGGGGLGQHVIQQLAYAGVGEITVIDDEELSLSNLNRYILARHDDPIPGTPKVDLAERAIHAIDPDIKVNKVFDSICSVSAFAALQKAPILTGCLDNDGARLVLTEFARAYQKDYFDLASDISTKNGLRYGGRILFTGVTKQGCPVCLGEIDLAQARADLESDASRKDREHLYGVHQSLLDEGGPSVVSINGVVASLAVTELMVHLVGIREPKQLINYRGDLGTTTINRDPAAASCYYCESIAGAGIKAGVERYIQQPSR